MSSRFLVRKIPRSKVTVSSNIGFDAELANIVAEHSKARGKEPRAKSQAKSQERRAKSKERRRALRPLLLALCPCYAPLLSIKLRQAASLSNFVSMSSESKSTVLYQNLDTSFVNLWGLLRKLTQDGFIGRVRVELKD